MLKQEAIRKHRKLWRKIAELISNGVHLNNSMRYKQAALRELGETDYIIANCYCCHYAEQFGGQVGYELCNHCPVIWTQSVESNGNIGCLNFKSEYTLFEKAILNKDYNEAEKIAMQIAKLPIKKNGRRDIVAVVEDIKENGKITMDRDRNMILEWEKEINEYLEKFQYKWRVRANTANKTIRKVEKINAKLV